MARDCELLHPCFPIGKPSVPLLFLDTFIWKRLLELEDDVSLLRCVCAAGRARSPSPASSRAS
jgi:hypothetical protein